MYMCIYMYVYSLHIYLYMYARIVYRYMYSYIATVLVCVYM